MELKITADKKLLDALNRLTEAIRAAQAPTAATEEPTPKPQPAQTPPRSRRGHVRSNCRDPVSRERAARRRGQDSQRQARQGEGADRVSGVAEEKLAAFKAELEAL